MQKYLTVFFLFSFIFLSACSSKDMEQSASIYQQSVKGIDLKPFNLDFLKNKVVLFVNIATQCGYTDQLIGLEKLYQKYKEKEFVIIGMPSNDFGGQTPEKEEKVRQFCKLNYGVTFPLTEKVNINSSEQSPLIDWLTQQKSLKSAIKWNFEKFLVTKEGKLTKRYPSGTKPLNTSLLKDIESLL